MLKPLSLKLSKLFETKTLEKKDVLATKEDLANVKQELSVAIAKSEARLTMRMFYFWMGQVAVIAGLLAYFFKVRG